MDKFWIGFCRLSNCDTAFNICSEINCADLRQCKKCIDFYYPKCTECFDELLSYDALESVGENTLLCNDRDKIQISGCKIFCRSKYNSSEGDCVARRNEKSICDCFPNNTQSTNITHDISQLTPSQITTNQEETSRLPITENTSEKPRSLTMGNLAHFSEHLNSTISYLALPKNHSRALEENNTESKDNPDFVSMSLKSSDSIKGLVSLPNRKLASASGEKYRIDIWDLEREEIIRTLDNQYTEGTRLMLSKKNGDLITVSFNEVKIWDIESGKIKLFIRGRYYFTTAILNENEDLITGSSDGEIRVWSFINGSLISYNKISDKFDWIHSITAISSEYIAVGYEDSHIRLWNIKNGSQVNSIDTEFYKIAQQKLPDECIAGSHKNNITVWCLGDYEFEVNCELSDHKDDITALVVSKNGYLVSGSKENQLIIWNILNGEIELMLNNHTSPVSALAIAESGELISGSDDGSIIIWKKQLFPKYQLFS